MGSSRAARWERAALAFSVWSPTPLQQFARRLAHRTARQESRHDCRLWACRRWRPPPRGRKSVRLRTSIRRRWRRCRWAIVPRFHPPRWMQNSASRSESSLRIQTKQERQGHPSINRIFTTVEIVLSCLVFVPPPPRLDSSVLQLDSQAPQIPGFFVDFNAFPMLSHAVPGTVMTP